MELQEIIKLIKVKRRHGLIRNVSKSTGVSMPTVKKYLDGDIISPKALLVIKAALEEVNK